MITDNDDKEGKEKEEEPRRGKGNDVIIGGAALEEVVAEEGMALMLTRGGLMASAPVDDVHHPLGLSSSLHAIAIGGGDAKPKQKRRKCSHPGCGNNAKQGRRCITHGTRRKGCAHPGCSKATKLAGYCSTHGPSSRKCDKEGCDLNAVQGGQCITHGTRHKDYGRLQVEDDLAAMVNFDQLAYAAGGGGMPPSQRAPSPP
jgi:hypothetical protein